MEPIKDLDLLVSEAERMSNTFRVFEALPRVLQVIQSAHNMPAELEKEIKAKQSELKGLKGETEKAVSHINVLNGTINRTKDSIRSLEGETAGKKSKLLALMDNEVREARERANAKVLKSLESSKERMDGHDSAVKESEEKMTESIIFNRKQADIHSQQEKKAKALADEAKATLEKIRKSFAGEGD